MAPIKNKISPPSFLFLLLLLLLLQLWSFPRSINSIPVDSLETILFVLRTNGHSLFANSISTSDLLFDLLGLPSLTLLSPPDPSLFALDMTLSPSSYLSSLRLHVIPNLDLIPNTTTTTTASPTFLPTLLPSRHLHVSRSGSSTYLDGVLVIFPPLYRSTDSSVYRLISDLPSLPLPFPLAPAPAPTPLSSSSSTTNRTIMSFTGPPVLGPSYVAPVPNSPKSVGTMHPNLAPVGGSFWSLVNSPAAESPLFDIGDDFSNTMAFVRKHRFKGKECGALDVEKMQCSLKSLSEEFSDYHDDDYYNNNNNNN